jgi:cob(I)alamin adenosyltransferase
MTRIYTKGGDKGETSLANGQRVSKSSSRVCLYGEVDELNSCLGFANSLMGQPVQIIVTLQSRLFDLGAMLANPDADQTGSCLDVDYLENEIDKITAELPELKNFILPAGCQASCAFHVARSVCRRVERSAVNEKCSEEVIQFVNRISDYLFTLARFVNMQNGVSDVEWARS